MGAKGNTKGRYMTKIGFYDIYAKDSYRSIKDGSSKHKKPEISSTEYVIYHSKKLIQKGFKFKDDAIQRAKELLGVKYREIYNVK